MGDKEILCFAQDEDRGLKNSEKMGLK